MRASLHPFAPLALAATLALAGCASTPPLDLAAVERSLGGEAATRLSIDAQGRWYQFGQAPAPGQAWPAFELLRYHAELDFPAQAAQVQQTRRQIVEPGRARPTPVDQQVDQAVLGAWAWNRAVAANGQPGAVSAQPAAVAERQAELWSTPQGFVRAAREAGASLSREGSLTRVSFKTKTGVPYEGWINAQGDLERVRTVVDSPVLGDTPLETRFEQYRDFGGLRFPARVLRLQGGHPVLDLQVSQVRPGRAGGIEAPAEARQTQSPAPKVEWKALASGVHYLTGGTHHSVLVEQRDHLVLVEAPQSEERSLALLAAIRERLPAKPVRYVINTHAHFDHAGGLRTLVDAGATVVTVAANKPFFEQAWAQPHTLNPDALSRSGRRAQFETFQGRHVISDGQRRIELHELAGNGHNDAFALIYLPAEKIAIQADAYNPGPTATPPTGAPNPYTVNLLQNIERLGLQVEQIAPLHGPRTVTVAELRTVTGEKSVAQR